MLLCRLLSWLHLASVVAPGSPDCLRFVLIIGQAQSGKASLFTHLVAAPAELAGQLGGSTGYGAEELDTEVRLPFVCRLVFVWMEALQTLLCSGQLRRMMSSGEEYQCDCVCFNQCTAADGRACV